MLLAFFCSQNEALYSFTSLYYTVFYLYTMKYNIKVKAAVALHKSNRMSKSHYFIPLQIRFTKVRLVLLHAYVQNNGCENFDFTYHY